MLSAGHSKTARRVIPSRAWAVLRVADVRGCSGALGLSSGVLELTSSRERSASKLNVRFNFVCEFTNYEPPPNTL